MKKKNPKNTVRPKRPAMTMTDVESHYGISKYLIRRMIALYPFTVAKVGNRSFLLSSEIDAFLAVGGESNQKAAREAILRIKNGANHA